MERQLVTIQKIIDVKTHPNADSLDLATVLGWQVVVKRNEFKSGDFCVFFEVDSLLPPLPVFDFMKNKNYRVRTIRLRKELSQGLAMPLAAFPEVIAAVEGHDVTELLGVKKFEGVYSSGGEIKGAFPFFIPKTDEIRIQTIVPRIFDEIKGKQLFITEKMDGTSGTFFMHNGEFGVCSRNYELTENDSAYWKVAKKYDLNNKLRDYNGSIAIQGEVCGPKIQNNPLQLTEYKLFVFSIYLIDERRFMNYDEYVKCCRQLMLDRVPCLTDQFYFDQEIHNLAYFLDHAKGKYEGTNADREGIVIRPIVEIQSDILKGRLSFKVLNNDYLENEE